ncbi:mitochondrial ribosomal protein L20 [Arctopsyche grandis]|uniref:mitochondrial ribosomal protein L20 n=1 Tax=Arctopsyche grandis TaxID=121162 RepID=UPI00406D6E0E
MVFLTVWRCIRSRGPDEYWRKRRMFRLAAHYIGRRRNCYSIAVRNVHRALAFATQARQQRKFDERQLQESRLASGAAQHNASLFQLREGLDRSGAQLNRVVLADLAIWEPRSFEALLALGLAKFGKLDHFGMDKSPTGQNITYHFFTRDDDDLD